VLDQDEWKDVQWRSDPKQSDTNNDGKLSKAEFCERIVKFWGRGRKQKVSPSAGSPAGTRSFGRTASTASSSSSDSGRDSADKVRSYAKGLLNQYDANKDGVLQKDEWSKMKSYHQQADANNDNVITLDELAAKLASYGKQGRSSWSSGSSSRSGTSRRSTSASSRTTSERSTYRTKTPTERLPRGLPDWFPRNDTNGDGQVAMSEYSAAWSDLKAREFIQYDLNGDGFITPAECLAALEEEDR
jgi:Ca2+-binding EF-hand superfamily protein